MTNFELEFLAYNLESDVSEFAELYLINMSKGLWDYKRMFSMYLLSQYMEIITIYDLDKYDMNVLSDEEMVNILDHVNIILNKDYSYDFKQNESLL